MDAKNYTQVLIDGKIYTLGGMEDESYLQKAASYVNEKNTAMRRLPGFSKQSADYQMAMVELNIADDYFKAMEHAEEMERQRDSMEKETYSLKHELVSTQMKLEAVLKDLEERQRQMEEITRKNGRLETSLRAAERRAEEALQQARLAQERLKAGGMKELEEEKMEDHKAEDQKAEDQKGEAEAGYDTMAQSQAAAASVLEEPSGSSREASIGRSGFSDEELAKKALQAAKKAGSHRGGRR